MLTEERREKILHLLDQQKIVKSQDLVTQLNASESTIRRDLQELENEGLLERIHGGAKKGQLLGFEPNMSEKTLKNVQEKQTIAQLAAMLINEDEVIYLDAGSTTLEMIPFLQDKKVTIVTNSVKHAAKLVDLQLPTIILGGQVKISTNAVLGSNTIDQLKNFHFNKAFMGMNGADLNHGFTTPDPEEAAIKRLAMANAEESFVLIDHSKFNQLSFTSVAPLSAATIVTERCPMEFVADYRERTTIKEAIQ
ncbi:DeoR family transcriptional regulator [Enterococcus villorum]|jgi:DeoR family fructose operon transcriptional repressor|uniref:DeoR family transcriptional regulator n=1 Tax=Enterococcus villorum TaxID=112904 RepID=A0A1V8YHQ7_9ENTE|nr:DeoR/GlpR family DNA-binding transcription regulator [Enterococcus villorum]OQO71590.1 DeoR family transcriptional regulator [Enterococcus villorum]OQO71846.1 DeoR family transcriptional regulator [Enterococcus villorum]